MFFNYCGYIHFVESLDLQETWPREVLNFSHVCSSQSSSTTQVISYTSIKSVLYKEIIHQPIIFHFCQRLSTSRELIFHCQPKQWSVTQIQNDQPCSWYLTSESSNKQLICDSINPAFHSKIIDSMLLCPFCHTLLT